ncbi:hypothetical protein HDU97_003768 [Phlyctochytrium planicorne]|nr:hypothetical protein HDU97_003768 [Phlyctochytrium planicorne]
MKATFFALAAIIAVVAADSYNGEEKKADDNDYLKSTTEAIATTTKAAKKTYAPECDDDVVTYGKTPVATPTEKPAYDKDGKPVYQSQSAYNNVPAYTETPAYGETPVYNVPATKEPVKTNIVYSGADSLKASAFVAAAAGVAALFL